MVQSVLEGVLQRIYQQERWMPTWSQIRDDYLEALSAWKWDRERELRREKVIEDERRWRQEERELMGDYIMPEKPTAKDWLGYGREKNRRRKRKR